MLTFVIHACNFFLFVISPDLLSTENARKYLARTQTSGNLKFTNLKK